MHLIVRLKALIVYFMFAHGQRLLTKSVLNSRVGKAKNRDFSAFFIQKSEDEFLLREVLDAKRKFRL